MHKLLLGRDPVRGDALASQPTLSRFENDATRGELRGMGEALFETVLDRHRVRQQLIEGALEPVVVHLLARHSKNNSRWSPRPVIVRASARAPARP